MSRDTRAIAITEEQFDAAVHKVIDEPNNLETKEKSMVGVMLFNMCGITFAGRIRSILFSEEGRVDDSNNNCSEGQG